MTTHKVGIIIHQIRPKKGPESPTTSPKQGGGKTQYIIHRYGWLGENNKIISTQGQCAHPIKKTRVGIAGLKA